MILDEIETLFQARGADEYIGEAVSQLEHALQSAMLAEEENAPPALVVAALLHDVGHFLHSHGEDFVDQGIDDLHEERGQKFLVEHFGPEVTEPVRLHVVAKRYMCATREGYHASLSLASQRSLELQGGPMNPTEVAAFEKHPHHAAAVRLRLWDDKAKIAKLPTPPLSHFMPKIRECMRATTSGT
ncbi:MAG: phosphonate degradation HD-domain oxygenase [Fimbriiglobus sp.]